MSGECSIFSWRGAIPMTYFGSRAVLAIASRRLRRPNPAPAVQGLSHGTRFVVTVDPRFLKAKPPVQQTGGFPFWSLAMTYSHMGRPHTTIGDASFHC